MAAVKKRDNKIPVRRRARLLTACICMGLLYAPGMSAAGEVPSSTATSSPIASETAQPQAGDLSEDKISAIWSDLTANTSLNDVYATYFETMQAVDAHINTENEGTADQEARDATYFLVRDGIAECEALRDALKPLSAAKRDWLTAAGRSTEGVDWAYRHAQEVADAWIRQLHICKYALLYLDYIDAARLQAFAKAAAASSAAYLEHWYNMYLLALLDFTDADTAKRVLALQYTGEYADQYEAFERYWTEDKEVLLERTAQAWVRVEDSLDSFLRPSLQAKVNYPWFYAYLAYAAGKTAYALDAIDLVLENPGMVEEGVSDDMKAYCAALQAYLRQQLEAGDNRPFAFVYGIQGPGESLLEVGDILVTLDGETIPAKSVFLQEVGINASTVQVVRHYAGSFTKHEFRLVIDPDITQISFFPTAENLE